MKCQAITKSGAQCSRDAVKDTKFCWQHQNASIVDNDELTDKQRVFCEEYIVDNNGTRAAIAAGYSEKTARQIAANLLTKVNIQKEIAKLREARSKRTQITADMVLQELAKIGFADIKDFLSFRTEKTKVDEDEDGNPIYDYATIVQLKESDEVEGNAISEVQLKDGHLKFKLHDKIKALEDIGKHLDMFKENVNVNLTSVEIIDDIE